MELVIHTHRCIDCDATIWHDGTQWVSLSGPCPADLTGEGLHDGTCYCDE